ncbi:hypothetical protein [Niabella aquatica]
MHTPTKWNFWHFSIRWHITDKNAFLNDIDDLKEQKKIIKRLKSEARALIAKFASIEKPTYNQLDKNCFSV